MDELTTMIDRACGARQRVEAVVEFYAEWITAANFAGCGFHRALLQSGDQHDIVRSMTITYKRELLSLLEREVETGAACHLFLLIEGAMVAAAYDDPQTIAVALRAATASVLVAVM